MTAYVVRVNEVQVIASQRGVDWWLLFRSGMEPVGRITVITPSLGGDMVEVACDDREHANWLAGHMVESGGLPKAAVKAVRR